MQQSDREDHVDVYDPWSEAWGAQCPSCLHVDPKNARMIFGDLWGLYECRQCGNEWVRRGFEKNPV